MMLSVLETGLRSNLLPGLTLGHMAFHRQHSRTGMRRVVPVRQVHTDGSWIVICSWGF